MEDNSVHLSVQTPDGVTEVSVPAEAELGTGAQSLLGWFKQTANDMLCIERDAAETQAAPHWQRPQDRLAADDPDGQDS